jgi:hypothetical protein
MILLRFPLLYLHFIRTRFIATFCYFRAVSVLRCGFWGARILVVVVILCDVPGPDGVAGLCVIFLDVPSDPLLLGDSSFWFFFFF